MRSERYNGRMRLLASFVFVALLCAPFVTGAETQEEKFAKMCEGRTGNPTGSQAFKSTDADIAAKIRTYITERAVCPSACYDIAVVIKVESLDLTLNISAANKCKDPQPTQSDIKNVYTPLKSPNESRSCKGEKGPATITVEAPGKIEPPKSRCSEQATNGVDGAAGVSSATKQDVAAYALQTKLAYEIGNVNARTPEGQSQLSQVLQKFGMPEADANARVDSAEKAQSVQEQLQQLARATTPEQAQSIGAKLGLPLSGDLKEQSWLNPDKYASVITDQRQLQELRSQANDLYRGSQSTFTNPPSESGTPSSVPGTGATDMDRAKYAICRTESGCRYNEACYPGTKNCTWDGAWGKYQVRGLNVPSWASKYCGQAMSPQQFQYDASCQEKVFEGEFGGYVQQCGYDGAALRWFTGRCNPNPNATDGGLRASQYLSKFQQAFAGPIPASFGAPSALQSGYAGSPFAGANPFGVYGQGYYGLSVPTGGSLSAGNQFTPYGGTGYSPYGSPYSSYGQSSSPLGSIGGIFALLFSNLFNQGSGTSQNYGQSGFGTQPNTSTPSMSITAQPPQTTKGASITVTWSATGMSAGQPCVVYAFDGASTSTLANALSGAQSVTAQNAGTYRFTLQCIDVSGSLQSTTASVSVQ